MRIALCQRIPIHNSVHDNVGTILTDVRDNEADIFVYPELFLTGYFFDPTIVRDDVEKALESLRSISEEMDVAIVTGAPEFTDCGIHNCAFAFVSGRTYTYRKIHLPNFPPFDEKERFIPGSEPIVFEHKGFICGLSICYDIFFPELMKHHALKMNADVNICISASPVTSRVAFERVLPARAVENTTYVAFVNNIGPMDGMEFFGGSRLLAPNGDGILTLDEPGTGVITMDKNTLEKAREMRPVLKDSIF